VEEARQHSALRLEQRLFESIYLIGSLVLVASVIAQMFWRIDALYPAILGVGCTRICLAAWQLIDPDCSKVSRARPGLVFLIVAWASTITVLIWMHAK
jgi:hypothetical protein